MPLQVSWNDCSSCLWNIFYTFSFSRFSLSRFTGVNVPPVPISESWHIQRITHYPAAIEGENFWTKFQQAWPSLYRPLYSSYTKSQVVCFAGTLNIALHVKPRARLRSFKLACSTLMSTYIKLDMKASTSYRKLKFWLKGTTWIGEF